MVSLRPSVTVNVAFIFGSSKQGNARRASVDSNWVTASHLLAMPYLQLIDYVTDRNTILRSILGIELGNLS